MVKADDLKKELKKLEDKRLKEVLQRFFKTGKGGYAENDLFLGINVGTLRAIAEKSEKLRISARYLLKIFLAEHT